MKPLTEPLLLPAVLLGTGILASRFIEFRTNEANFAACWIAFLCLFAWWRGYTRASRLAGSVLFLFVGIWTERAHRPDTSFTMETSPEEVVTIEGCVVEPPSFSDGRERLVVELTKGARVRLTMNVREGEALPKLQYGDRIETGAKLRKPHNFGNPGAFDMEGYLAKQSILWTGSTPTGEPVKVISKGCGSIVYSWLYGLREMALDRIEALYPGDTYASAMMQAILLGETSKVQQVWTGNYEDRKAASGANHWCGGSGNQCVNPGNHEGHKQSPIGLHHHPAKQFQQHKC